MAEPASTVGTDVTIRGTVTGNEDLVVEGRVQGAIALTRRLEVEASGSVEASIEVEELNVKGTVDGEIVASRSVSIAAGAVVRGTITTPQIVIESGARFSGQVSMEVRLPQS